MSGPERAADRARAGASFEGRLVFAQVREDPTVEVAALSPRAGDHVVGVSSGGDTALALLRAGAGRVSAVDSNRTQNHHVELIDAALRTLAHEEALQLIGATPGGPRGGVDGHREVAALHRLSLSPAAHRWWREHPRSLLRGPLHAGSTERMLSALVPAIRYGLTSPAAVSRLLAARTPSEQSRAFDEGFDSRRWRFALQVLLNPVTCRPLYRRFFDHVDASGFGSSMRSGIVTALREVPIWQNWYLHDLFEGRFRAECLPGHLREPVAERGELNLVDGDVETFLRALRPESLAGVWLSNVAEWLPPPEFDSLLRAAVNAVRPGGRIVWCALVPRREPVPAAFLDRLTVLDPPAVLDRSLVRYQRVICERR